MENKDMGIQTQESIAPTLRRYRTWYPDTQECVDSFAEGLSEVYREVLKRPGTAGVIKVFREGQPGSVGSWIDCLGFEIPAVRRL